MQYFIVLDDGETYASLRGCAIIAVPDDIDPEDQELELFLADAYRNDHHVVTRFT